MGRRDLSQERRNQILDAFKRCIVQVGLASTTVTKVADEAKMKRSMIHHYVGDRNDLLAALLERYIEADQQALAAFLAAQTAQPNLDEMINYLFSAWTEAAPHEIVIVNALLAETAHNPNLRELCLTAYKNVENAIAQIIRLSVPDAELEECETVAFAIVSMMNGSAAMLGLGFDRTRLPALQDLVKQLIQFLDKGGKP